MRDETFEVGDWVYAGDWCYGQIVDIDFEKGEALVEFDTGSGGGSLWFEFGELTRVSMKGETTFMKNPTYSALFDELTRLCHELDDLYVVKKIRWYMVEVWTKGEDSRELLDIFDDNVLWFDDDYVAPSGVMAKIRDIQDQMAKIADLLNVF